jgi:hypothetical protein
MDNFQFLEFGGSSLPGVVHMEGLEALLYLGKPTELARCAESIEDMRDSALTPRDTVIAIHKSGMERVSSAIQAILDEET